jgi:hypothetical protein
VPLQVDLVPAFAVTKAFFLPLDMRMVVVLRLPGNDNHEKNDSIEKIITEVHPDSSKVLSS